MGWLKSNWVPLLVGGAVGYYLARNGGVKGVTGRVKGSVGGS